MTENPLISVLLPVYNAEKYIGQAIQSILNQSYKNFELIIINDGSTDDSETLIKEFKDERIVYFSQANAGLATTLNTAISRARGAYIARQDNDDVSLPERLQKQINFMLQHPACVLLGTWAEIINESGLSTGRSHKHPTENISLKFALLFNNPFVHSSVMFKKEALLKHGAYTTNTSVFEDYDLWSRLAFAGEIRNLDEYLLQYREVHSGMSKTTSDYVQKVRNQSLLNISRYCTAFSKNELAMFVDCSTGLLAYPELEKNAGQFYRCLEELKIQFCKIENINSEWLDSEIEQQRVNFKRMLYNSNINSKESSYLSKLGARLNRKFLFWLKKKYL